ncbi:hypothetical protein KCU73_g9409, partial [Aureobasidium melanogenum]
MRTSAFFAAPLVAMVAAQSSASNETSVLSTIPISSTVPYTNGFTSFLTQTNSLGVVTGIPTLATDVGIAATNAAVSSAAVQLVPAGLAPGTVTTLIYGNVTAGNATSIVVTVGASTTQVLSAAVVAATGSGSSSTDSSGAGAASSASASGSSGSSSGSSSRGSSSTSTRASGTSGGSGSSGSSSSATASSTGSAANVKVGAAGALIGAGAFFAAFM